MRLGEAGGALDLGVAGAGAADADVLGDRAVEEAGVLEDDGDRAAQAGEGDVGDVVAVDQDAPRVGLAQALEQRERGGLAGAGRADEGDGLAGRGREVEVEDSLIAAGEAVGDGLVADGAARRREIGVAGAVADLGLGVDELEVAREARGLLEDAGDEGREPVELADQQRREGGEGDDLADADLAALHEERAGGEDQHHGDGGCGAGQHGQQVPPGQDRVLGLEQLVHHSAHRLHLGGEAGVALHHGHVADDVTDAAGEAAVVALDRALAGAGLADDEDAQRELGDREDAEDRGHAGVEADRGRDQQQDRDDGGQLLAQDGEPEAEERVGAGEDGADDGAGAALGVPGDGALEGAGHRREPAAVGEAVGGGGDERAGKDAEEPEAGPEADQAEGAGPAGQRVDHAAEEDRLGELGDGEQDAGHDERDRERPLGGEQRDGAAETARAVMAGRIARRTPGVQRADQANGRRSCRSAGQEALPDLPSLIGTRQPGLPHPDTSRRDAAPLSPSGIRLRATDRARQCLAASVRGNGDAGRAGRGLLVPESASMAAGRYDGAAGLRRPAAARPAPAPRPRPAGRGCGSAGCAGAGTGAAGRRQTARRGRSRRASAG